MTTIETTAFTPASRTRTKIPIDLDVSPKPGQKVIQFYGAKNPNGEFSNFYPSPIVVQGKKWPTTEHYFQAKKFEGTIYEEQVRLLDAPVKAAKMGKYRNLPKRKDWMDIKLTIMYEACYAKFTQHQQLKKKLLDTGDAFLVEHTKNDKEWGDGGDAEPVGTGNNKLGKLLMKLRDDLRKENAATQVSSSTSESSETNRWSETTMKQQQQQ